jgi:peptidyl-prolyl cis-trans isomerase C
MPRRLRNVLLSMTALALTGFAGAWAQQTQTKSALAPAAPVGGPTGGAGGIRGELPGQNDVLATVVDGNLKETVTKGELIRFLSRYQIPEDEDRQELYSGAMERLINTKLLTMFLARQQIPISPEKIDEQIERLKQELKRDGQDLGMALVQNNISLENIRREYEDRIRWTEYLGKNGTEAMLRRYASEHRDLFGGTQIRASHILIKVDPGAPAAEKEKAKQTLAQIKKDIQNGTTTFAAAANKFSQDDANDGKAGGDLDYFTLTTGYVEEFTDVAFKLKKGVISDPVETPFGFHLITVTDRKEGKPVDFEQNKPYIAQEFGNELQRNVVNAERKRAKIDIMPLPKDLFPSLAPTAPASGTGTAPAASSSGAGTAPAPKAAAGAPKS